MTVKMFLGNRSKTILSAAVVLGAASLVSRFLGLARDRILAGAFGAGDELDIYYAAFRIPDLIFSLLVFGAVSAGFVPIFIGYLQKNRDGAWRLAGAAFNLMALSLAVVCLLAIVFTPWLMKLVAPGFSHGKMSLTVQLTRIMFLSPFFLGLSAIFGGVLQSFRCFLAYSLGPIAYNLGIIFGALFLISHFGLFGLAYGVVLGALLHMLIRLPVAYSHGFRWQPILDFRSEGVRRIFKLMPPRILSLVLSQVNLWAMTFFASFLAAGSITISHLAFNVWCFPVGVFGVSFTLAAFPKLSEAAQKKEVKVFIKVFSATVRRILFLILPASALFIILRFQIIQTILATGRFGAGDVSLTAKMLAFFSLSLFTEALILLVLRGFFAWEDTKTPFLIGLLAVAVRLYLTWYWSRSLGVTGLALGFSLGSIFHCLLLCLAFRRKIRRLFENKSLGERALFVFTAKTAFASLAAALSAYLSLRFLMRIDIDGALGALVQGGLAGLIGIAVYLLSAWLLKIEDLSVFSNSLFSSVKRLLR